MRLLSVVALVVVLALPARAQTPGQSPAPDPVPGHSQAQSLADAGHSGQARYLAEEDLALDQQAAFLHFATQYTEAMVIGLLTGGLVMNRLVGGLAATLAGTVAGAIVASWFYLDQASGSYVIHQVHDSRP